MGRSNETKHDSNSRVAWCTWCVVASDADNYVFACRCVSQLCRGCRANSSAVQYHYITVALLLVTGSCSLVFVIPLVKLFFIVLQSLLHIFIERIIIHAEHVVQSAWILFSLWMYVCMLAL